MWPVVTVISAVWGLLLGLTLGRARGAAEPVPTAPVASTVIVPRPPVNPWRLVIGAILIVLGVVAAIFFAFKLSSVLTLAVIALLLAVGLQGPVARLRKLGLPRPVGLLTIYLGAILGLVVAGWLLLPPVYRDLRALAVQAPTYFNEAQTQLGRFGITVDTTFIDQLEQRVVSEVTSDVGSYLGRALSILSFTVGLLGGFLSALLVLVLSIFFLTEGPTFRNHLLSLLPPDKAQQWDMITLKIALKIQGWLRGTLLLGGVVGSITIVGLVLLGMPYPFLLGLIAGIGELIPMIGPIIAAVPAVGIAAFYGWGLFLSVLILYIVIQQVENYLLVPRIMGSSVDLPGLFVLVAFLIGSELLGVTGAILSVPAAAVVQVLWLDWIVPSIRGHREPAEQAAPAVSPPPQAVAS